MKANVRSALGAVAALAVGAACANGTVADPIADGTEIDAGDSDAAASTDDAAPSNDDAAPIDWDASSPRGGWDSGRRSYDGGTRSDSGHSFDSGHAFDASNASDAASGDASGDADPSSSDASLADATTDGAACGWLVPPNVAAQCQSCTGQTCQSNGCFGGWWCDTSTARCHAPPTSCP